MKFLVTSDWHIQNSGMFARPDVNGLTTRAIHSLDYISWMGEFCVSEGIDGILFCGDMFTSKSSIPIPLYNAVYNELKQVLNVPIVAIPGNHDKYMRVDASKDAHTLYVMGEALDEFGFAVISDPHDIVTLGDVEIIGAPPGTLTEYWDLDEKELSNRILLIHENIIGARYQTGKQVEQGTTREFLVELMVKYDIDICFCGDIHEPQIINEDPPIVIVGNPFQMDFGETTDRGYWLYDTEEDTCEFRTYDTHLTPRFVTVSDDDVIKNFEKLKEAGTFDYFRFQLSDNDLVEKIKRELPSGNYILDPIKPETDYEGFNVNTTGNYLEAVREYAEMHNADKQTLNIGIEYMNKAL